MQSAAKVATRTLFEQEMMRERMREFPGMGQTFYALKHYNRSFTDFRNIDTYQPSDAIFNLPWPDRENEYGDQAVHNEQYISKSQHGLALLSDTSKTTCKKRLASLNH